MGKPTEEEVERWARDSRGLIDFWAAQPETILINDLQMILDHSLATEEHESSIGATFRIIRRLGLGMGADALSARTVGLDIFKAVLTYLQVTYEMKFREGVLKSRILWKRAHTDEFLADHYVWRAYELARPGGVADRIAYWETHQLSLSLIERDLKLSSPAGMKPSEARAQAAKETAELAAKWYGEVPQKWAPNVGDRALLNRFNRLLRPYWHRRDLEQDRLGHVGQDRLGLDVRRPGISPSEMQRRRGRPRKK